MHSNTLSAHQRTALVRSSQKLYKVLGDVPRVPDDDTPSQSTWHKRKPTHLPPLLKLNSGTLDVPDSPESKAYPSRRGSVLSLSPSIVSNAPSTASCESTQRRTKLERLRRKLGRDVPTSAVFPPTPTPSQNTSRARAHPPTDDARSIAFSVNSDESVHQVSFTTRVHKTKHATGALPPLPVPAHDGDDAGLMRPRPKMAAGSMIGGADFKAARRAKREGRSQNGAAEPWELVEMVGFMC